MAPSEPPSCDGRLHRVLLLANQRKVTPFHTQLGRVSVPHPSFHSPGLPSPPNSFQAPDHPRLVRRPLRERAGSLGVWGPTRVTTACSRPRSWPQPPAPLQWAERKPTTQPAKFACVCALPGTLAESTSPALQPLWFPRRSRTRTTCRGPGRGCRGLGGEGSRASPSIPHSPPPAFWKGVHSAPGSGPQTPSELRREDAATHRAPGPATGQPSPPLPPPSFLPALLARPPLMNDL